MGYSELVVDFGDDGRVLCAGLIAVQPLQVSKAVEEVAQRMNDGQVIGIAA